MSAPAVDHRVHAATAIVGQATPDGDRLTTHCSCGYVTPPARSESENMNLWAAHLADTTPEAAG